MARPKGTRSKQKPQKEPESQRKISLTEIPHRLVFEVLKKIPNVFLIRMRKTCSYINNTVENNKEALSKRSDIGFNIIFEIQKKDENPETVHYFHLCRGRPHVLSLDSPFEDHFSALSFKAVYLNAEGAARDTQGLMETVLRRLKLSCVELNISLHAPLEYHIQLADLVESRETCFGMCEDVRSDPIPNLLTAHRKSVFSFVISDSKIFLKRLEEFTNFRSVSCNAILSAEQQQWVLTKLTNLSDLGALKELRIRPAVANIFNPQNSPSTKLLWKMEGIPEHPHYEFHPEYIRKFELADESRCALVIKLVKYPVASIKFVKNTVEDVLEILLQELKIRDLDISYKKKYFKATEEAQMAMIRDFYWKKHVVRRSMRLLDKRFK